MNNLKPCPFCGNETIVLSTIGDTFNIQCWPKDGIVFKMDQDDFERFQRDTEKYCCFAQIRIDPFIFESKEDAKNYLITMWNRRANITNKPKIKDVHTSHCCGEHKVCKYGEEDSCTVCNNPETAEYPCNCGYM